MKKIEHLTLSDKPQRGLVIGLGGTGAAVLASNRRRIIGKYGSMENVPMLKYLYIDTDPKWWNENQATADMTSRLSEPEYADIQVPATADLYRGIKRGSYSNYAWFDIQKLETFESVTDGAGTVRQMARLAFWQHYKSIREKIEAQIEALKPDSVAEHMLTRHGIELVQGITVYIVAGLAGGTGSGLWLDTAYLVQEILKDMGIAGVNHVVGYGVLPQAFKDLTGADVLMANGYAALKELNYFSYRYSPTNQLATVYGEPVWDADYRRDSVNRVNIKQRAPFEFCYLLDARNAYVDLHRKDIFNMIDTAIYHEFVGSFAAFKRSLRCNVKKELTQNDGADCPMAYMSFGQSGVSVPLVEIKQVLAHQLALQAVQHWTDRTTEPIKVLAGGNGATEEDLTQTVVGSIKEKAKEQSLVGKVQGWLRSEFIQAHGINQAGVFAAVVQEHKERLTDIPYALLEAAKQEWIAENWDYNAYIGRVTAAWETWRTDFSDEGGARMQWGEQIGKLASNKEATLKMYRKLLRMEAFRMFEDSEHFGPAWAVCAVQQLKSGLGQLKQVFLKQAGDANHIANALGDVYVIDAVTGGRGPSLSAIIEDKTSKNLALLADVLRRLPYPGKRKAVSEAAYQYLRYCALWCRAKVEERARREAADLMDQVNQFLGALEEELIGHAAILASLEQAIIRQTREWNEKASRMQHVGVLLYDADLIGRLDDKLRQMRGGHYSGSAVARKGLQAVGRDLRELRPEEVPVLMSKLIEAGLEAVGDLTDSGLNATEFAAHDFLSAEYSADATLDSALRAVIQKSDPYIRVNPVLEDGGWSRNDLTTVDGAGMRGGKLKENDQDPDHARIIASLARNGWNVRDGVRSIDDGSQIVFFKECGGFPLRALQGVAEMKEAYEQHRRQPNKHPLHIMKDEMADCFPDLFPPHPEDLERARLVQTVAIPLGFISQRDFPSDNGNGTQHRQFAFLRHIKELDEEQPLPLGRTLAAVGMKLANSPDLLAEIERAMDAVMTTASGADKAKFAGQLRQHLAQKKNALKAESPSVEVENAPAYQQERERCLAFIRKYGLASGGQDETERTTAISAPTN